MTPARPERRARGDDGLTLVEVMVTLSVLSIVMSILFAGVLSVQRTTRGVDERLDDQGEARVAIAALTRDLRTAAPRPGSIEPPFTDASATSASFYARIDGLELPRLVTIAVVDETGLTETVAPPIAGTSPLDHDTANAFVRFVARDLVNATGEPLLRFYDATGAELVPPAGGSLSVAERRTIRSVGIHVAIKQNDASNVRRTVLQTQVRLPNA